MLLLILTRFKLFSNKKLFSHGFVNYLLKILRDTAYPDVYGLCCYGIAKMTQYGPAAVELTEENPSNNLLSK